MPMRTDATGSSFVSRLSPWVATVGSGIASSAPTVRGTMVNACACVGLVVAALACAGESDANGTPPRREGTSRAADLALKIGQSPRFLVGLSEANATAVAGLGVNLDLFYRYLVGLPGSGGWPEWNPDGSYVDVVAARAEAVGAVPMYTLHQMAAWGDGNLAGLSDAAFMGPYWDVVKLLFQRLATYDKPALVQFEPDFWGYAEQLAADDPSAVTVRVTHHRPECATLTDDLRGMGGCLILLAQAYAPKALIGFHASRWGHPDPAAVAAFLNAVGAASTDFITLDTLDRDAGCFEAHTDPKCQRTGSGWYWDETNTTSPNFAEHLAYARSIAQGTGRPILWWQTPLGVPSTTPGGSAGTYRDNRVRYLFSHVQEFVDAGGVGAVFGVGAANQTSISTDGGQFQQAVTHYLANPVMLP